MTSEQVTREIKREMDDAVERMRRLGVPPGSLAEAARAAEMVESGLRAFAAIYDATHLDEIPQEST